ncbi:MAG: 3-deoxy-manno-octulosonate cytidylyltransferase [Saprospiraceae bacterium]|nr:3-deoxy-manno-octulosonate cytidylyltransferase [Saprospiraceae bacterium]MBK9728628.1 3-deoxy-manno-octulosonate cytidylyltransferase [Saprospiraceae bacterium]
MIQTNNFIGLIPARYGSQRLPGKLLKEIEGKSVLHRVFEQVSKSSILNKIVIVTDHEDILNHAISFGAEVFMSKMEHQSGTDRIAEYVSLHPGFNYAINIQGDEPFIDPKSIDLLAKQMTTNKFDIATLAIEMSSYDLIENPNTVKVVTDFNQRALYFSRSPIPFLREQQNLNSKFSWLRHIGLYSFKRDVLLEVSRLPMSSLEQFESLEQLRWLQNGYSIGVQLVSDHAIGIDTMEDLVTAISYARKNNL